MNDPNYIPLDILATDGPAQDPTAGRTSPPLRPWIGVLFECCGAYARVHRQPEVQRYDARCPRCGRLVTLRVGPDGTDARFFRAAPG